MTNSRIKQQDGGTQHAKRAACLYFIDYKDLNQNKTKFAAQSTACGGGGLERFTEHTLLSDKLKDRRGVAVPDPMGVVAAHAHLKEHRDWLHDSNNAQAIKVAANGQADAPTKLGVTAYATIKMSKKPTEKSLSSLVNTRVRTRLLTVWTDGAYCPYDVIPTNMDRNYYGVTHNTIKHP